MNGVTATDSTGCVTVTLSDRGHVNGIRLSARWRDKLGTSHLAGALTEAWFAGSAASGVLVAWSAGSADGSAER